MTRARARAGGGELARALSIVVALVCARRAPARPELIVSSGSIDPCHPAHYDRYIRVAQQCSLSALGAPWVPRSVSGLEALASSQ